MINAPKLKNWAREFRKDFSRAWAISLYSKNYINIFATLKVAAQIPIWICIWIILYRYSSISERYMHVLLYIWVVPFTLINLWFVTEVAKHTTILGKKNKKKFNEQIKLLANFIGAVAIALLIGSLAKPMIDGDISNVGLNGVFIIFVSIIILFFSARILEAWQDDQED